jgi:hypothetical protein
MKSLLLIAVLFAGAAQAQIETKNIERSRKVVPLTIALNNESVRCLIGDYGASSLKISLPELKGLTVFPQTTRGETDPCINAGVCKFGKAPDGRPLSPELVIDSNRPTEDIQVTVVLTENLYIDHTAKTCSRSLSETISSPVRGLNFAHEDGASIGDLPYDVCVSMH